MVVTPHSGDHSLSDEKAADEISVTGGPRRLSPIDVNGSSRHFVHTVVWLSCRKIGVARLVKMKLPL